MKRFCALALLVLFALSLAASPATAGEPATTIERYVVPYDAIAPPHHDCITESVHYQGFYEITIVTAYNAAGGFTSSLHDQ
jgi:hypothetical protein